MSTGQEYDEIFAALRELFGYHPDEPVDLVTFITEDVASLRRHVAELRSEHFEEAARMAEEFGKDNGERSAVTQKTREAIAGGLALMLREAKKVQPEREKIHDWFELSYAQYLTIPRSVLQSMPDDWQERFVELLEELDEAIDWRPKEGTYQVTLREVKEVLSKRVMDYERGRRRIPHKNERPESEPEVSMFKRAK